MFEISDLDLEISRRWPRGEERDALRRGVHASREEASGGPSASDWKSPSRPNSKFSFSARPSSSLRRADEWMPRIRGSPPRVHPFAAQCPIACASEQSVVPLFSYSKYRAKRRKNRPCLSKKTHCEHYCLQAKHLRQAVFLLIPTWCIGPCSDMARIVSKNRHIRRFVADV